MPEVYQYILLFVFFLLIEMIYLKLAKSLKFVNYRNLQNNRLDNYKNTIRGGGFIFVFSVFVSFFFYSLSHYIFLLALSLIALISFLDDFINLDFKIRLFFHFLAASMLLFQFEVLYIPFLYLIALSVFIVAILNAYNFMDGINGLTGSYSLLTISFLYYINLEIVDFTSSKLLIVIGLSLLVFNFFNFRKTAKCFAGDVGSVAMAYIVTFLIGQLILSTSNFTYILLLLVYGVDTAFTVLFRKIRGENIFEAHCNHFYQFLSNRLNFSHLLVSMLYVLTQFLINIMVLLLLDYTVIYTIVLFILVIVFYLGLRFAIEGKKRLLSVYD